MSEEQEEKIIELVGGWLHVWEIDRKQEEVLFSEVHRPQPKWEPKFCVCAVEKGIFSFHHSELNQDSDCHSDYPQENNVVTHTRLDGGKGCFHRRWGYKVPKKTKEVGDLPRETTDSEQDSSSLASTPMTQSPTEEHRTLTDSYQVRSDEQRRESLPTDSPSGSSVMSVFTTFRLANFFIRKGSKSSIKTSSSQERKSSSSSVSDYEMALINVKGSRSHESVLATPPGMNSIDLRDPNVDVLRLHSSVLGQNHCLQVATSEGSKYIFCTSSEERDKWLNSLRRSIRPQDKHSRRSDSSLKLWIQEATKITPKKRYFCDILLDQTLYAKTSVKTMTEMLFWGEHFEFKNLPDVQTITINLYREADKKKKKDKNLLIGYINLSISEFENRHLVEKWITCFSGTVGKSGKETKSELPNIRIKARRQIVDILPLECYNCFIQYLCNDYKELCHILEPLLVVREKDDFAVCLVHILQDQGKACKFLSDVVLEEISRLDDEHLTFRGNSIATKAMEAFLKLVGEKYLQNTLGDLIHQLVQSPDDCEVDPTKVATPQLLSCQQKNLDMYSNMAWVKIINSFCYFPNELREVFASFRSRCSDRGKGDYSDNLISSCIFLRFLCPAILSPSLFNLTQEYPNERAARNLTLIAKTIQTLANFTQFGVKEEYMTFMNAFVDREAPNMKIFLLKISSGENNNQFLQFDGDIDLGKELSVLHALLLDCTEKHSETAGTQFENLKQILSPLTNALNDPTVGQKKPNRQSQMYDNLMPDCVQTKSSPQNPFKATNSLAKKEKTTLLSPTGVLIDMLRHCGESTEDLPALANYHKSFGKTEVTGHNSTGTISDFSSYTVSPEAAGGSSFYNEQKKMKTTRRRVSAPEEVYGDYVDLIPLVSDSMHIQSLEQSHHHNGSRKPLGFANPLFRHQQQLHQSRQSADGAHYGVSVSQAHAVQRMSSDSSDTSDADESDTSWLQKLIKTSSSLDSSVSSDPYSPISPAKKLPQLQNFTFQDSFNKESTPEFTNSSNSTFSSDFVDSPSFSSSSFSGSVPTSFSYINFGVVDSCGTFPRRRQGQQELTNYSDVNAALTPNADKSTNTGTSATFFERRSIFQRQLSSPRHGSPQNTHLASRSFQSGAVTTTNQIAHAHQGKSFGVKSSPGVISHVLDNNDQSQKRGNNNPSPLSSPRGHSTPNSNNAAFFGYSSPAQQTKANDSYQIKTQVNSKTNNSVYVGQATNISKTGPVKGMEPKLPSSLIKSTGWQIAQQVEKFSSLQENSSICKTPPNSLALSADNSMSGIHEFSSVKSSSSLPSSPKDWGNITSHNSSSISIDSFKQTSPHSTHSGSVFRFNTPRYSPSSNNVFSSQSSNNNTTSIRAFKNNPNMAVSTSGISSISDTQINSSRHLSSPLPQPPAFLQSKYAVVHPHTTSQTDTSKRATSYHSAQEITKPRSKKPHPFTTSHSLDLGDLSRQTDETLNPAVAGSAFNQSHKKISPLASQHDEKCIHPSSTASDSAANRRPSNPSTVHMGINSVMKKLQEHEKTKKGYEQEVHILRQQLLEAQERLQQTEMRLLDNELDTHKMIDDYQYKLVESEEKMRKQQEEKDEQMKTIVQRYHTVEDELKKEHAEMVKVVEHKQQVIEVQEQRIQKLDEANMKLLQALADLKVKASSDENSNSLTTCGRIFESSDIQSISQ